jgi:hypothetical protein
MNSHPNYSGLIAYKYFKYMDKETMFHLMEKSKSKDLFKISNYYEKEFNKDITDIVLKTMKDNTTSFLYPPDMDENIGFGDD